MSLKERLKQSAPDWLLSGVFNAGRLLKPGLERRAPLVMCCHSLSSLSLPLPDGFHIERISGTVAPPEWIAVMASAGIQVSESTWKTDFATPPTASVVAIRHKGAIVGTAGLTAAAGWPRELGLLTWVGIRDDYQGQRLAGPLISGCLQAGAASGMQQVLLFTDDHRVPAIKTYLKAGFRPWLGGWDWTQRPRWRRILRAIKAEPETCRDESHAHALAQLGQSGS